MTVEIAPPMSLGPRELVEGRAFTDPEHVEGDRATLGMLARDVNRQLTDASAVEPLIRFLPRIGDWRQRIVISRPDATRRQQLIAVVGFFGRVRENVDPGVADQIKELSDRLVDRVLTTPGLLAYSTQLLADGPNYANLVLLSDAGLIERWRTTAPHPRAADVSPRYYECVRIYHGSLTNGALIGDGEVALDLVKYWDYRSTPVWHAIRDLA